jgi:hypothetical protein
MACRSHPTAVDVLGFVRVATEVVGQILFFAYAPALYNTMLFLDADKY